MTKEEINKVIEKIREHCKNNSCPYCDAYTVHGCAFMTVIRMSDVKLYNY